MFTHDLFAVANLVVEHCYSIRQWKSSTSFVDRGKAEGVRRGREENGNGRGKGRKCVFTILATDYFSIKFLYPWELGPPNQIFENLTLKFSLRSKLPTTLYVDRVSTPLQSLKFLRKSEFQKLRNLCLNI